MESINENMKTTLKGALNFIFNNNYFTLDSKIYKQNNGTSIESPISGLLDEFILQPLETDIQTRMYYLIHGSGNMDDIFNTWQHENTLLNNFFNQVNSLDSKIKLTLEIDQNGTLPYLDVLLIN